MQMRIIALLPHSFVWFSFTKASETLSTVSSLTLLLLLLPNSVSRLCANIDRRLTTRPQITCFDSRDDNSLRMWRGQAEGPGDRVSHGAETLLEKDPCDFPPSPKTPADNEEQILFSTGLRGRSNVRLPGVFPLQPRWEVLEVGAPHSAWLSYCVKFPSCVLCTLPAEELIKFISS